MERYEDILKSNEKFRYQMLSRLQMDCNYYLGYGNRGKNALWTKDEREQIELMKELWKSFKSNGKPEWLTWDDITNYETEMIK
ncbi:hypothetical protein QCQ60_005137 [Bacillus cereus]|nr:hypothetical protein [Bacillus cereus]